MKKLNQGDKVKLLPISELLEIFERRQFFSDEFRKEAAETLGDMEGFVEKIEDRYAFDFFYFFPDGKESSWSIPYQAVKF